MNTQINEQADDLRVRVDCDECEYEVPTDRPTPERLETLLNHRRIAHSINPTDPERLAVKLLEGLYGRYLREVELVMDLGGRSFEVAVCRQIDAIRDAMRKGDAPAALQNLSEGLATAAALAVANGRWAATLEKHIESVEGEPFGGTT